MTAAPPDPSDWLATAAYAARTEGDVCRFREGWLFAHPDAVRDVLITLDKKFNKSPALRRARVTLGNGLLTNEGPSHRRQRALISPSLHPRSLGGYGALMARNAAATAAGWQDGVAVDLHRQMTHLTLSIVAEALFTTPIGPEIETLSRAMHYNVTMFRRLVSRWGRVRVLLPTPFTIRYLWSRHQLVSTLRRFIKQRRKSGVAHDDLLARLLAAREEGDEGKADGGMSERQLIDECVTMFAAGHETTANTLTFTLRLLALHPDVQQRVHEELDTVLAGRPATMADVARLTYTRQVAAESMRVLPPVWIQGRQAKEDLTVAGQPIRRGEVVYLCQWVTHRDARWWPDPERFDPDRFAEDDPTRPRWAFFPFGAGARSCVGEAFAWSESVLCLATLLQHWRVEHEDTGPLLLDPGITLRPASPVRVVPKRRS